MILVAGGTGFIGRSIVAALRREGHEVRVLSRGEHANPFVRDRGVSVATGDVREADTLPPALDGVDTVICAVQFPGHPVELPKKGLTYDEFDRRGTENLVAAAQKAGVLRFVYISGAGVGQGRPQEWFVAKEKAEAAVRGSGMNWTILRPSWVYGPRDKSLNRLAFLARVLPVVPLTGAGKNRIRPVHVDDVAAAVVRALVVPEAGNQVIEIGGPQFLPMREVVRLMLQVMGKRRIVLPAPPALVKMGARVLVKMPGRILSPRAVDFANVEADVDTRAMREILGMRARPFTDGISYLAPAGGTPAPAARRAA